MIADSEWERRYESLLAENRKLSEENDRLFTQASEAERKASGMTKSTTMFYINNGQATVGSLERNQGWHIEHSLGSVPDPRWEHVDVNGHFHARSEDKRDSYPTLTARSEHVDCDGSCMGACEDEGYTITRYFCQVCGAEVEPGTIPGPHVIRIPGLQSWEATVEDKIIPGEKVTVRVVGGEHEWFGVAIAASVDVEVGGFARTHLVGVGPLGTRKTAA